MTDLLEQGVSWLDGMRAAHLARQVTYERGDDSVQVAATLGATTYEVADEAGAVIEAKATDFLVSAEALVLAGEQAKPEIGDRIRVPAGEKVLLFEVLDLGGVGHYRPADPFGKTLRIHARQVATEAA